MNRLPCLIALILFLSACKKDGFISGSNASLQVPIDSLSFDTVFTGLTSVTRSFPIHNQNGQKMLVNSITLKGGSASSFRININGNPSGMVQNEVIDSGDSLMIFVEVSISPNSATSPFSVRDSIEVIANGRTLMVQLQAFGQNAHFMRDHEVSGTETWTGELPYVILGKLHIPQHMELRMLEGTRVYCHDRSIVQVDGRLTIQGTAEARVRFSGDRLDVPYTKLPGSWQGLRFGPTSTGSSIAWAEIRNAIDGITLDNTATQGGALEISNSVIDNCEKSGITSINSSFTISNSLISNNGQALVVKAGSAGVISYCTIVGYSNELVQRNAPLVQVTDTDSETGLAGKIDLDLENSILWGDNSFLSNDLAIDRAGTMPFDINFSSCILSMGMENLIAGFNNCSFGADPVFVNDSYQSGIYNFRLQEGSPAIDAGVGGNGFPDLDNQTRTVPDLGCYEYLP